VILDITKRVTLQVPPDQVWSLLQDPPRVAGFLPNVRDFRPLETPGRYATLLVEKLGPFSVQVALTIDVSEDAAHRKMTAKVAGDDKGGQARVRGDLVATVQPEGEAAATLEVASNVEVLGRLATLGAVPMRRRADQIFEQFVQNIGREFGGDCG
jgi:carbon monoxide dehydrogenase subunit G